MAGDSSPTRWTVRECPTHGLLSRGYGYGLPENWCPHSGCHETLSEPFEVVKAVGARTSDPDTSKLAALRNQPRKNSQRAKILDAIRQSGSFGMTARECEASTGIDGAWKRVSELKQGGHIVSIGTRLDRNTGAEAEIFTSVANQRPSYMDVDEEE